MQYRIYDTSTNTIVLNSTSLYSIKNSKCNIYKEKRYKVQYKLINAPPEPLKCKGCLENLDLRLPTQCKCCCKCCEYKCQPFLKSEWKTLK